jgi:hypothetical protein
MGKVFLRNYSGFLFDSLKQAGAIKSETSNSVYFGAAWVSGAAPLGWIFTRIDSSAGVATAVLQIPTVVDFPDDQDPCRLISSGARSMP